MGGCCQSKPTLHAYYEPENSLLVAFDRPQKHFPKKELNYVTDHDSTRFKEKQFCYLISTAWHTKWYEFATKASPTIPPPINNAVLLNEHEESLLPHLKLKRDFRPINQAVWEYLFRMYGGGPAIVFQVPSGLEEEAYLKGQWIKHLDIAAIAVIIHPNSFPKPVSMTRNPLSLSDKNVANAHLAVSAFTDDLSKAKLNQAKKVQQEINQTNMEMMGHLMAKDLGKKKMEEAKAKEQEQNVQMSGMAAHLFAGGLSDRKKAEAKQAQQQADQQTTQSVALIFNKGSIKKQFKEALAKKNIPLATQYAAVMVQNAWKSKQARRKALALKQHKQRLLEEAMARKLQCKYRARLAHRRMEQLKIEKQRLREEGCAILVQSNWRIRQARQKVLKLKAEKQRLMEEFAALKVQSRWRVLKAQRMMSNLKEAREAARIARLALEAKCREQIYYFGLRYLAKRTLAKRIATYPYTVLELKLISARDINIGDVTSSDPYVLAHVEDLVHHTTKTIYRSKVIYNTLNPIWNESCYIPMAQQSDALVLTLMDKDNFTKDDFLGQSVVHLQKYPALYHPHLSSAHEHAAVATFPSYPIDSLTIPLRDLKQKPLVLSEQDTVGKGDYHFTLTRLPLHMTHVGYVQKNASQLIGFGSMQFKNRFMLLVNGILTYYESEHTVGSELCKGTMKCAEIKTFQYGPDKTSGVMTLYLADTKGQEWYIRWMDNDAQQQSGHWLRKIALVSPKHLFDTPTAGGFTYKELAISTATTTVRKGSISSEASGFSTASSPNVAFVDVKNRGKIGRRASHFFKG